MNIQLQMSGVCILILLFYLYKRQGNLGLYIGKLFIQALSVAFICLMLDIISVILIVNQDMLPMWLVKAECKAYLGSLVWIGYVALVYANADIRRLAKADKFTRNLTVALVGVVLLIFMLPINTFYDGNQVVYTYGPACYATYAGALLMIFATLFKLIFQGKMMNPRRRSAITLWVSIWIIAAIVQFFNSKLLLVGFASAVGMFVLFFELENPEIYIDRSTGVYNTYGLEEYIRQKFQLGQDCCGVMLSLEDINGKNVSPVKLETAMAEIVQFIRQVPGAMVFKVGGREFALSFDKPEALEKACELIRNHFQQGWAGAGEKNPDEMPLLVRPRYLMIPSITVAKDAEEMMDLLKYFRMRTVNNTDSDTLVLDEKLVHRKREREEMIETIRRAIREDRVEVFYQPIYSLSKKKFVSAEALARIRQEDGSIIPPGLFIPIAEETGLVAKIGRMVFEKTCRLLKETDIIKYGIEYIEVNLSVVQCENRVLAGNYISIMKKYDLPPAYVNLEITESAAIVRRDILLENMRKLIDYGVTFSLDDFGNGQSNLNYIVDMPVQIVKFDRDMIQAYFETSKAPFVVQAATDMAHNMKLKVVAEGVETMEQLALLEGLDIDYIQGYCFSKPIEEDAFLAFVREKNMAAAGK